MPVYREKKLINGQNRWFIKTYVKLDNGKCVQKTKRDKTWIGRDGYWEACQEEARMKRTIYPVNEAPNEETNDTITFEDLFYLKMKNDAILHKNSESTRMSYEENLRHHVFPYIGHIEISKLNSKHMETILLKLNSYRISKGKNKGKEISVKFKNEIIHTVKNIIAYGIDFHNMSKSLLKYLTDIKQDKDKIIEINPLELIKKQVVISPTDWAKITIAMEQLINRETGEQKEFVTRMMLFFTTEYILLTRVGETQGMKYSKMLFDNKIYCLYEAYNKRLKKMTPTKNRESRILYIPDTLYVAFKRIYSIDKAKPNFNINQFIFSRDGGKTVFPRTTIDRWRKNLLKKAGIEKYITNHELRHAGISNAIFNKVDLSALADMAGHDKEIMLQIYTQTLKEANSNLIQVLDKLEVPNF